MQLAWARDRDGNKLHVARVDPKDRRARGPFTCLGCGEPLVPHLGEVRARHFAHLPGSTCPLTAPETALHLDAKERLLALCADAFGGVRRVTVLARCPSCRRLAPRDLAEEGDRAEPEGAVGLLRADVLVSRGGAPRLALEVLVTHAVEPEKEAALAAAGVPAVEVDATEEWEQDGSEGVSIVVARSLGFPPCPTCAAQARADADRDLGGEAAEIAELEAYRARGLFGPAPRQTAASAPTQSSSGTSPGDQPLAPGDRAGLEARFTCPECGGRAIGYGARIARHACEGKAARPIAWRGYDGTVVELSWWRRRRP
ncbi:competence protein CoiA family protein [Anaeromyxobacter oryzae]|uniref:Competence protein CoiA-like N-terminal domain-containing protein n=1 Tax=Anaeromyxobacter oryzae TaxID=2918170 RepID=A0ABM7WWH6_9BACT|nr:competence protein CoiA family protein [Anaeromyxobacter oryzae]BDG03858.1 hypothetical protein AMOR_28540 [Anaeromyxobacter oryzae]